MIRRVLGLIVVAALLVALVLLLRVVRPVEGQTPAGTATGEAAATPWGEPDLQGIWTRASEEPLQRPSRFANQEFFTDEERAEYRQATSRHHQPGRLSGSPNTEREGLCRTGRRRRI